MNSTATKARISRWFAVGLLIAIACVTLWIWQQVNTSLHPLLARGQFEQTVLAETLRLFDLGVACIDEDDRYDVFSVNHSNRQLLHLQRNQSDFQDHLLELGLSQCRAFPGIDPGLETPEITDDGLYVFWEGGQLVVTSKGETCSGTLGLPEQLMFETRGAADIREIGQFQFRFELADGGRLKIVSYGYYFAIQFKLDDDVALDKVFVGTERISPSAHSFELPARDRHAMAWADYNDDGRTDVAVFRGGGSGRLLEENPDAVDELLVFEEGIFVDRTVEAQLRKQARPARSVQWVDANADGRLDLYVVNGRSEPPNQDAANQLFLHGSDGQLIDAAAEMGLDLPGEGSAQWVDVGMDSDLDLIWAGRTATVLFVNEAGQFRRHELAGRNAPPTQATTVDMDNDGDTDVFFASKSGNALWVQEDGTFREAQLSDYGLPRASLTCNWVDYDNDGNVDLHLLPQGLYQQRTPGRFETSGLMKMRLAGGAHCSWFDADGDGRRDALLGYADWLSRQRDKWHTYWKPGLFRPEKYRVCLYRNLGSSANAHWQQITLRGPSANRPAIGARVELIAGERRWMREVGHAEGSRHSQGQYRLYFGLGDTALIDTLRVHWPDSTTREQTNVAVDQHLVIAYDEQMAAASRPPARR